MVILKIIGVILIAFYVATIATIFYNVALNIIDARRKKHV